MVSDAGERAGRPPVVSVVMPTFQYAAYLEEAVASVRGQTFEDWECLIVDDGSTDDTPVIATTLEAADPRIRYVRRVRSGVSAARNAGVELARGELVQFLDADDLLRPGKLAAHVTALREDPLADVAIGPVGYFDDGAPGVVRGWLRGPVPPPEPAFPPGTPMLERLLVANQMVIEAPLIRVALVRSVQGFDERMQRLEDWDLWLRCALAGARFLEVPSAEPLALVRVHATSMSFRRGPMYLAEVGLRRSIASDLVDPVGRSRNEAAIDGARARAGMWVGLEGRPAAGLRVLLPVALARRRASWLAWSLLLAMTALPGGRRLASWARSRRS